MDWLFPWSSNVWVCCISDELISRNRPLRIRLHCCDWKKSAVFLYVAQNKTHGGIWSLLVHVWNLILHILALEIKKIYWHCWWNQKDKSHWVNSDQEQLVRKTTNLSRSICKHPRWFQAASYLCSFACWLSSCGETPNCSITNLQIEGFGMWLIYLFISNFVVITASHNRRYYT